MTGLRFAICCSNSGKTLPQGKEVHERLWKKLENGVSVWIVSGRLVRSLFDIDFTAGGHDYVYEFVPENEIWIDNDIVEAERGYAEELEHWAWCIRNPAPENQPRCHAKVALKDAVIALTSNKAAREGRRIEFKESWFEPESDETPDDLKAT